LLLFFGLCFQHALILFGFVEAMEIDSLLVDLADSVVTVGMVPDDWLKST
jgi:hypothetical protein